MMRNPFSKEYNSGRKDQFDVDYAVFKKSSFAIGIFLNSNGYTENYLIIVRVSHY